MEKFDFSTWLKLDKCDRYEYFDSLFKIHQEHIINISFKMEILG